MNEATTTLTRAAGHLFIPGSMRSIAPRTGLVRDLGYEVAALGASDPEAPVVDHDVHPGFLASSNRAVCFNSFPASATHDSSAASDIGSPA